MLLPVMAPPSVGDQDGLVVSANNQMSLLGGSLVIDPNVPATHLAAAATFDNFGSTALSGDITPTALGANTNDWAPAGLATTSVIRMAASAAFDLTGLTGGADGRIITLMNIGTFTITLKNSVTSAAANQFLLTADVPVAANESVTLMYDTTASRWKQIAKGTGTAGGSVSFPLIASPVGTVSAPAYSFTGDTGTGMFRDTASTVSFAANGVRALNLGTVASGVNYFTNRPPRITSPASAVRRCSAITRKRAATIRPRRG